MNLCSIVPVKYSKLMYNNQFVMLLAHLSEKYPEYSELSRLNADKYRIMDNSIIELGNSFSMEKLITEAKKCKVNEIILPDVFQNGKETIKKVKESIKWLKENEIIGQFNLMAVCHAKNKKEFKKYFKKLNKIKEIDTIGIPKVICKWANSRENISFLFTKKIKKKIHFLGVWDSLNELFNLSISTKLCVRSVDTCMPALLTMQNKSIFDSRRGTINLEYSEMDVDKYNENINLINNLINE